MKKEIQGALAILSILALLNVMFVPIFDVWGGLFPSDPDYTFFDTFELAFDENDWDLWVVQLTFSIFFPSVFMLITALIGKSGLFLISNCTGLFLVFKNMWDYMKQHADDMKYAFDVEDGNIAIGTWIAIGLFFVSSIVVTSNRERPKPKRENVLYSPSSADPVAQKEEVVVSTMTCPSCGYEQPTGRKVCWKCAKPFINMVEQPIKNIEEEVLENRFCTNCGKLIESDMNFCIHCGMRIKGDL